ncbi:MAG: UDP-glucose 4-epimerase GalE [Candidatus Hydrogenedentota bacterium]
MSKRAFVTGAGGFAGRRLCEYLVGQGWDVIPAVYPSVDDMPGAVECDVSDLESVDDALSGAGEITHVFHLAAVTFVPSSVRAPLHTVRVNLEGTMLLAAAVKRRNPSARFLFTSSAAVYGIPSTLPIDEFSSLNPVEPYAISKAAADSYCRFLYKSEGLDAVVARPFNHSGPGQTSNFVLSDFARQIATIEAGKADPVVRVGDLSARRDFLHVDDVVRAYALLAEKGEPGEAYNVCSGRSRSIQEALDWYVAQSRVAIRQEVEAERLRKSDIPDSYGSHAKLTARTGWQPTVTFEELLGSLLEYWRNQQPSVPVHSGK